jgi:hypothetical protein
MGEKKESAKHWLGVIAIGCALAVACVAAAPLVAVVGVTVAGISISAAAVTGTTAVVAAIGATAALTKAGLHLSDGEYQEAVESAVMAVPLIGAAGAYGSMYLSQVRPPGNMTTGATSTQSSSGQNIKPNQNGGKVEGAGTAPTGYTQDVNGRWHRPNGQFASNSEISSSWGNPNGWIKPDGSMNYPPNNGAVLGTEKTVT